MPILTRTKELDLGFGFVRAEAPAAIRPMALAMRKCSAVRSGISRWSIRSGLRYARLSIVCQLHHLELLVLPDSGNTRRETKHPRFMQNPQGRKQ